MKIKTKLFVWGIALALIMLLAPHWAVVLGGENGMALCFILFFAVNPLVAFVSGIISGTDAKRLWMLPICVPAAFLMGIFINFGFGEELFVLYAAAYLAIGLVAMFITMLIKKAILFSKQRKR